MRGWILLSVSLPAMFGAQPSVTINPVPSSLAGVTLIGPGDPAYLPAVQSLIAPDQYPAYQPMLPYSVVVRNDTGRAMADVCVIFVVTQAAGHQAGSISECPGNIPPSGPSPLLARGAAILVSAAPQYTYIKPRRQLPSASTPRMAQVTGALSIVISLDSAVFSDGTMAGPDSQSNFQRYSAHLAADRDFAAAIKALESAPEQALKGYLDQLNAASRAGSAQQVYEWEYNHRLGMDARGLKTVLSSRHADSVFSTAAGMGAAATAFPLHH
jgi:hypothetical protein